jgi:hypothetical protein
VEDQERTEQTPEEEKDVEAHTTKYDVKDAPAAAREDEGEDVEAHTTKYDVKDQAKY